MNDRGASSNEYPAFRPQGWLPRPQGKGADAEVNAVAGIWLAVRRISVVLSQKCGELSEQPPVFCGIVLSEIAPLCVGYLFLFRSKERVGKQ